MKRILCKNFFHLSLIFFSVIAFNRVSLAQEGKDTIPVNQMVVGVWIFDYELSESKMKTEVKDRLEKVPASLKSKVIASYQDRTLTFESSGDWLMKTPFEELWRARWSFVKENLLTISDNSGFSQEFKLILINKTDMILSPIPKDGQVIYFPEWHFKKQ